MEMRINVQDHKVSLLKELLEDLPFVTIENTTEQVLQDLDESVKNLKKVQAGELQATPLKELLHAI
ncbi:MAG: hypothetical protein ACX93T_01100 [Bacteroidota bacterium]